MGIGKRLMDLLQELAPDLEKYPELLKKLSRDLPLVPGPKKAYSNVSGMAEDSLVELVRKHYSREIAGKEIVVIERDNAKFKTGIDLLRERIVGNTIPTQARYEISGSPHLEGKETCIYCFSPVPEDDEYILGLEARLKMDRSLAQKMLYMAAKPAGDRRALLDEKGSLQLKDVYGLTVITNTPEQAKELLEKIKEMSKRGSMSGYDPKRVRGHYASENHYNAYHITVYVDIDETPIPFEIHLVDAQSHLNNNSRGHSASHLKLQDRKIHEQHSAAGKLFFIVNVGFGYDISNPEDFHKGVIDHTFYLTRVAGDNSPLLVRTITAGNDEELWDWRSGKHMVTR